MIILMFMNFYIIFNSFTEAFGTTWTKQYCTYQKDKKEFTMIPYNQLTGKFVSHNETMLYPSINAKARLII